MSHQYLLYVLLTRKGVLIPGVKSMYWENDKERKDDIMLR